MIQALDHILLAAAAPDAAVADYEMLLGRRADRSAASGSPAGGAFQLANMRLDLAAATAGTAEGLCALVFAVADVDKARHLLGQRALPLVKTDASHVQHIAAEGTHGVPLGLVERAPGATGLPPSPATCERDAAVVGLDHVVIRSPNPERAVALYAGRLGLSLRLDRSKPAWGTRLLFFRCGDLIVEVAHDLKARVSDGPDRLWGVSWRVPDVAKAHARLRTAGVDVSDVRPGRRPRTQVFTAKSHSAGVPTLVIGDEAVGSRQ